MLWFCHVFWWQDMNIYLIYSAFISGPALLRRSTEIQIWRPIQNKGAWCPSAVCAELLSTNLMIQVDHVFLQWHIRVHIVCCVACGTAPGGIEAGTPVQLTGTHNSGSGCGRYKHSTTSVIRANWRRRIGTDIEMRFKSLPNIDEFLLSFLTGDSRNTDNRHTHIKKLEKLQNILS
jgi:hypothetical protein